MSSENQAIELHDSDLVSISVRGGNVVISLSPAYLHRSIGIPGVDSGSGWLQDATLTLSDVSISAEVALPATIAGGSLRTGGGIHHNCIPASGTFEGPIELRLVLATSECLIVRGDRLEIALQGTPSYLEDFDA
jgi:hypothetical protein